MSEIRETIESVNKNNKAAFIPYFILGYPDLDTSIKLIKEASQFSDVIEIGIPFSDPVADGPTIQDGVSLSLSHYYSLETLLSECKKLSSEVKTPLIFMMYFNPIFTYGSEKFLIKLKEIGIQGLIIPDLLPDSEPEFNELAKKHGIELIFLITPVTAENRVPAILNKCNGFLYFVSVVGITGERNQINQDLEANVKALKNKTNLPVCMGFGISKPEHVQSMSAFADGVIVGSAIVAKIKENIKSKDLVSQVSQFLSELNTASTKS